MLRTWPLIPAVEVERVKSGEEEGLCGGHCFRNQRVMHPQTQEFLLPRR